MASCAWTTSGWQVTSLRSDYAGKFDTRVTGACITSLSAPESGTVRRSGARIRRSAHARAELVVGMLQLRIGLSALGAHARSGGNVSSCSTIKSAARRGLQQPGQCAQSAEKRRCCYGRLSTRNSPQSADFRRKLQPCHYVAGAWPAYVSERVVSTYGCLKPYSCSGVGCALSKSAWTKTA